MIRQRTLVFCLFVRLGQDSLRPCHVVAIEAVVMQREVRELSKRATADVRLLTDCAPEIRSCGSRHCRSVIVKDILLHMAVSTTCGRLACGWRAVCQVRHVCDTPSSHGRALQQECAAVPI